MDESSPRPADSRWTSRDLLLLLLLAALAAALRLWQLAHTEVAARDSIGFIRYAWLFRSAPVAEWPAVLGQLQHHPLYPLWILAVSQVVEPFHPSPAASMMQLSAQLASALSSILLLLPMYALGRQLFDRQIGFLTALLIQCLPICGQLFGDGLSEATFLLFAVAALHAGVVALGDPGRWRWFALTGFWSGMAYLTRPESAVVAAATGAMLLVSQATSRWSRPWISSIRAGAALAAGLLLVAGPFIASTGGLTVKPTGKVVIERDLGSAGIVRPGPLLAVWDVDGGVGQQRGISGAKALAHQVMKGSFYFGWLAALIGIWAHRRRLAAMPGAWMLLVVSLAIGYALWRVVVVVGYLSDRHALLILACGMPFGAAGLVVAGEALAQRWPRLRLAPLLVPAVCVAACLPKTLAPLHHYRSGFRAAGIWLADHAHPTDAINDPLCWSHYHSGRVFLENTMWEVPPGHPRREYVVIENTDNPHPRLPTYRAAVEKVKGHEPVYRWKGKRGTKEAEVLIYALPLTGDL